MKPLPEPGDRATVVTPGTEPLVQTPGRFCKVRGDLVAITIDAGSGPAEHDSVVIVRASGAGRWAATGRALRTSDGIAWFHVSSPWRAIEDRVAPRTDTCVECDLVSRAPVAFSRGAIASISALGARVILDNPIDAAEAELHVAHDRGRAILPCTIVTQETAGPRVAVRLRFGDLNAPQRRAVGRLVAGLGDAGAAA